MTTLSQRQACQLIGMLFIMLAVSVTHSPLEMINASLAVLGAYLVFKEYEIGNKNKKRVRK
jgi:hypothetical protein